MFKWYRARRARKQSEDLTRLTALALTRKEDFTKLVEETAVGALNAALKQKVQDRWAQRAERRIDEILRKAEERLVSELVSENYGAIRDEKAKAIIARISADKVGEAFVAELSKAMLPRNQRY